MIFTSPSKGNMTFDGMFKDIVAYVSQLPEESYKLIIGTDSHSRDEVCFVTAVIVHRLGKGGRYYYHRSKDRKMNSLRQRIFFEAALSLGVASRLYESFSRNGHSEMNIEIHLDVGRNGETRDLIREVVGMISGSGFDAKIKPNSYGASKVADKHTK